MAITAFPFGDSLTLAIGTLSITFSEKEFISTGEDNLLGYTRQIVEDHVPQITSYGIYGQPFVLYRPHRAYFEWEIDLLLTPSRANILEAIYLEQQIRLQNRTLSASQQAITLIDERQVLQVRAPRTIAKKGASVITLTPPVGSEFIWPVTGVIISSTQLSNLWANIRPNSALIKIAKLKLIEAHRFTPAQDIP